MLFRWKTVEGMMAMRRLYVFDTTLRDGEQSLGITLDPQEKLEVARQLVLLGVDVIEAGFPVSSPGDLAAVRLLAKEIKGAVVCGLSRAVEKDIDACAEALREAEAPRIHTGIAVSPLHMAKKLRMTPDAVLEMSVAAVRYARNLVGDVEFYAEDAFRADPAFLCRVMAAVIDAGATVINIPDTVGYATPWEYGNLIARVVAEVPNVDKAVVSIHCHNDLGMATANSLAGILAGAGQVEGTINGIGERAGNTALEEVIMAVYSRPADFGVENRINTREIERTSRMVSRITGVPVAAHKAIVGANAFAHASGIHQDGVLKERGTYEIIDPAVVGVTRSRIVLTARSGRHALRHSLDELGYQPDETALDAIYRRFLVLADQKKEVFDTDLHALMGEKPAEDSWLALRHIALNINGSTKATASVTLEMDGREVCGTNSGDGPVDAVFLSIDHLVGVENTLLDYSLRSVSRGKEALGDATVKIRLGNNKIVVGQGISTDIIEASAKAYLDALAKSRSIRSEKD